MRVVHGLWDEYGQATVLAAVGTAVIMGFLGLAIDVGQLRYTKRHLQMAADAAALAGALENQTCVGTPNCSAMQTAAVDALSENGITVNNVVTNCGAIPATGLTIVVNNPPCALGSGDPNYGKNNFVEVEVSQPSSLTFAKILGFSSISLTARAQAMRSGNNVCMYALDPSGGNAITVDLLAAVVAPNCAIVDESTASNAFSCNLLATVQVGSIKVAGGKQTFLCGTSTVTTGATMPTPRDPLSSLPKPAVPACGTSTSSPYHGSSSAVVIIGTATLYPDAAYCGGISIGPAANVTFMPGTYVLTSSNGGVTKYPGGLTIDLASTVSGQGVTFYNDGPLGGVNFVATLPIISNINLAAPSSGTYGGILFFQDPGNTTPATILGTVGLGGLGGTNLQGVYYFPTAKVTYAASGLESYNTLIAYDIEFAVLSVGTTSLTSSFANNYSSLANGNPAAGNGAVLVQ